MKVKTNCFKIVVSLILLVTAILCIVNTSFAYFSTNLEKTESVVFKDLSVRFVYRNYRENGTAGGINVVEGNALQLYPASGTIERETPFELSLTAGGDPIANIAIQNRTTSCECYVRFWIDAFIVKKDGSLDKTTNYGKFFVLTGSTSITKGTANNNSAGVQDCYYYNTALPADDSIARPMGNMLTLTDTATENVPIEILGESLNIFISFEAVQAANGAFTQVFGDSEKGYFKSWQ